MQRQLYQSIIIITITITRNSTSNDINVMPFSLSASAANSSVENSMVARSVPAKNYFTRKNGIKIRGGGRAWVDGHFASAQAGGLSD
jgi:hypothetical protein